MHSILAPRGPCVARLESTAPAASVWFSATLAARSSATPNGINLACRRCVFKLIIRRCGNNSHQSWPLARRQPISNDRLMDGNVAHKACLAWRGLRGAACLCFATRTGRLRCACIRELTRNGTPLPLFLPIPRPLRCAGARGSQQSPQPVGWPDCVRQAAGVCPWPAPLPPLHRLLRPCRLPSRLAGRWPHL